ncbi:probable E3 ubiquitin-protein ligase ZFP1 isoform X2 [Brassica rapa]|uniref:RING-type E3 ubiquitin transferase n=1 Tax=Brassica campestris TaxID=3711 RepID=M4EES0_BRACM|nr:probable E3 ubiquitin-protein ligase ZFP1 isoform X2 [Brassica rapa]
MLTGLDMEQHSRTFGLPPPDISVPSFEPYDNNNSMLYGLQQSHHHQRPSSFGPAMSTPPYFHLRYAPFHAPPFAPGGTSTEHERDAHVMSQGYKRKSTQVMPGNFQYQSTTEAPFPFPHYGPQPVDERSVRNSAGAASMDPPLSHVHNNFIQGSYLAHPFPPPGSVWYDQHYNGNTSDGSSSSLWPQPPSLPYMHGSAASNSIDSGNVCFPRYHENSSSRNQTPFVYPRHNHFSHHPAPPPTLFPHLASVSYTVPMTIHDASYSHVGPVQSTGFCINPQRPLDDFVPAATLRNHGLPRFRAFPTDEVAVFREGGFYDAVDYVDHHQDMRLDIEDMSYEELLALSDHIGTVKTGISEEDAKGFLKRRTSLWTRINLEEAPSTDLETDSCTICQENYKNQDKIATLDCRHEYHAECLKKWLVIKNICPVCKSEALGHGKEEGTIKSL